MSIRVSSSLLFGGPVKRSKMGVANRDIRKVRKRQGEYPEFGHTQGEIQKKACKKVH
jgi:hypothetical protein